MDEKIKRSRQQEADTAKAYRGSRTVGSGNKWYAKGDVRTEHFLIENKRTDNKAGITLKLVDLLKIRSEALRIDRVPVLVFEIAGKSWAVIPDDDFRALCDPE